MTNPLTPNERSILFTLAIGAYAEKTAVDCETAYDQLDRYSLVISGDHRDVVLEVAGNILVRCPRQWLAALDAGQM